MQTIDRSKPVMVTGATGYVAGWLVKKLLDQGATVHACVRDPSDVGKTQDLQTLADKSPGAIRFYKTDLLAEGSYSEAMAGCELVFHTASPFTINVTDKQRDLVDPALNGTRNILHTANHTDSVKRVVLTSSVGAMMTDGMDVAELAGGMLTEAAWNTSASLDYQAYFYSKTVAEKAAWEMAKAQSRWDLVVINPSFVVGGAVGAQTTSESFNIIRQMGDGTMKAGAPSFPTGAVDVRDVAEAHISAGFTPSAHGRYIVSGRDTNMVEIAQILHSKFGDKYPIPNKALPKFLLWLFGPIASKGMLTRKSVSRNYGVECRFDTTKGIKELGMNYRPLEESLADMFEYMIANGYFK